MSRANLPFTHRLERGCDVQHSSLPLEQPNPTFNPSGATASNGHFALSVTDTGPGIAEEHQARIFEQFHQVDSSSTKAKAGTGLGLAIAKQIVEMHGGRIWVESIPGKGATFQMELPIHAENRKAMT